MRFLNSSKIDSIQLRECLDYLEKSCQIAAFQAKESDSYKKVAIKHGNSMPEDLTATTEILRATDRLAKAAKETLGRHEDIDQIPMMASSMHYAWWATFRSYSAWASAKKRTITTGERDIVIETAHVEKLMKEYQKTWIKARNEETRFLKHLKLNNDDISKIVKLAENAVSAEKWLPVPIPKDSTPADTSSPLLETDYEEREVKYDAYRSETTELTPGIKKKYSIEDVKWLNEFLCLYDHSKIDDITRLDSDNMPADYITTLEGTTILPPILKAVEDLPRPKDKQMRLLKKAFEDALRTAIVASDDVREVAEFQSNRIPSASIAFGLKYAAEMNEKLIQKLENVFRK